MQDFGFVERIGIEPTTYCGNSGQCDHPFTVEDSKKIFQIVDQKVSHEIFDYVQLNQAGNTSFQLIK